MNIQIKYRTKLNKKSNMVFMHKLSNNLFTGYVTKEGTMYLERYSGVLVREILTINLDREALFRSFTLLGDL